MYYFQGQLIYQSIDELGSMEVIDIYGERRLHFGTEARQSTMLLNQPNQLLSRYARAMMSWMLFKTDIQSVLMIGLGGGLLAKYLLTHFPHCQLQVVEYRREVVKIAHHYFGLPNHPQLSIKIDDGANFMRKQIQQSHSYDLILIDAFDAKGMANSMTQLSFIDHCQQLLNDDGMLLMNLWSSQTQLFQQILWYLQQVFAQRLWILPIRKRGNTLAIAFNPELAQFNPKTLKQKALFLEQQWQLEFPLFVNDLKMHNPHHFFQWMTL